MATPEINYKRLASMGIGGASALGGAVVGNVVRPIPSFIASWVGFGNMVDIVCIGGGLFAGYAGYLYAAKKSNNWPMEKKLEKTSKFRFWPFSSDEGQAQHLDYLDGSIEILNELRIDLQPDNFKQIVKDAGAYGITPLRFIKDTTVQFFIPPDWRPAAQEPRKPGWFS